MPNTNEDAVGGTGFRVNYTAEHRAGDGTLISTAVSVQPPNPPTCLRLKCQWEYFKASIFTALLAAYHSRRVAYAEANRHNKILERYRTGQPSPKTIWQAIHANLKLKCPVCRRFNVDPLLFGGT